MNMSAKRALVVITHDSEEIECVTPIDILRRAGVKVTVAGLLDANPVVCSRQVILGPEVSLAQAVANNTFDIIILPGGRKGGRTLADSPELGKILKAQDNAGRMIAAICAAPIALKLNGIGYGKNVTTFPTAKDQMTEGNHYNYKEDSVVIDGNLITSRGPGDATEWSLAIVEQLVGKDKADEVAAGMLIIRN